MNKLILVLLFIVLLLAGFAGCQKVQVPAEKKLTLKKDTISGKALWDYIMNEDDYDNYPSWPGQEGLQPGQSPHARFHEVYIHPVLYRALPIKERIAPYGSIIVKENLSDDKELVAYTVMAKIKDYSPENHDWFWAKYSPQGTVIVEGKVNSCISCHASNSNNDYILLQPLDSPVK